MSEDENAPITPPKDETARQRAGVQPSKWVTKIALALVALIVLYLAFRISAAFFPRWWAQRVADQVQGRLTAGTLWGLFYGFVFTAVPLLLLLQVRRRFFNWTWRLVVAAVAVLLAAPNWLTLSVVAGNSNASHAGERIFDVDAPNFRAGTLVGAVLGAAVALGLTAMSIVMARRKRQVKELRSERDELRQAGSSGDEKS